MRELGLDLVGLGGGFSRTQEEPFVYIKVSQEDAETWAAMLGVPIRRCYISDADLAGRAGTTGRPRAEIVRAKIPNLGSVMAGDFGEILTAIYLAARDHPQDIIDPKKWRLKEDRSRAAPYSDIVQFTLPQWPQATEQDKVVCAEVKTKSTNGASTPIPSAIADSQKDQDRRLIKTLLWLRERALGQDLGTLRLEHIQRFIDATDHPPAGFEFLAVAVVCESLVDAEVREIDVGQLENHSLVVISFPSLKRHYESVFNSVVSSVTDSAVGP